MFMSATVILTPEERVVVMARLAEAEKAYHQLMLPGGTPVRVVDQNGETVEFNRANSADLYAYITRLKFQLAPLTMAAAMRPATFTF